LDVLLLDLTGGRIPAGARALINQVSVDSKIDARWINGGELNAVPGAVIIGVLADANAKLTGDLPRAVVSPTIGLVLGATDTETSLTLMRAGYDECISLSDLTPKGMRYCVRLAIARSGGQQAVDQAARTPDPHDAITLDLSNSCPHCRGTTEPEMTVCPNCGARLTLD
jgi:hypothetical protein